MTGTSSMIPHWLLDAGASANAVLTYAHLARYGTFNPAIGEYERVFPSREVLAREIGISSTTLQRSITELEAVGALMRIQRAGNTTVYRLIFGTLGRPTPTEGYPPVDTPSGSPIRGVSTGGQGGYPPVDTNLEPIPKTKDQGQKTAPPTSSSEVIDAEVVDPATTGKAVAEVKPDTAQTIVANWIDYCRAHDIELTQRIIGHWAADRQRAQNPPGAAREASHGADVPRRPARLPVAARQVRRPAAGRRTPLAGGGRTRGGGATTGSGTAAERQDRSGRGRAPA